MLFKKLALLFCLLCWLPAACANSQSTNPYSYVTITNNTGENISVNTLIKTRDTSFSRGRDWDAESIVLKPYETSEVLWFSRNAHVKKDEVYQFDISLKNTKQINSGLFISLIEKGKAIFGSSIKESVIFPNNKSYPVLSHHDFEYIDDMYNNKPVTIYAKSTKPFASLFNNFHFVIDQSRKIVSSTPNNNQISLLSYNTQMMPFYAGGIDDLNQPGVRALDIPKKIGQFDVVILQELFDKDRRRTIINKMNVNYPYRSKVVGHLSSKPLTGGVMIFSKWPIVKEQQIVYQSCSGLDKYAAKGAMYVAIIKNNRRYHIIGTHLQAGNTDSDIRTRLKQLQEMKTFIDYLDVPIQEPLFISGDFNVDMAGKEFDQLKSMINVSLPANHGHPYSFDAVINSMAVGQERSRLDYVFYSKSHAAPSKALNNVYVLRDLDNSGMWPKFDLSDHFPVAGFFDFSQPALF